MKIVISMSFDGLRQLAQSLQSEGDAGRSVAAFVEAMNGVNRLMVDISIRKDELQREIAHARARYAKCSAEYANRLSYCAQLADENIGMSPKSVSTDNIALMPIDEFVRANGRITAEAAEGMPADDLLKFRMEFEVEQLEQNMNVLEQRQQARADLQRELDAVRSRFAGFTEKMEAMFEEIREIQRKLDDDGVNQ